MFQSAKKVGAALVAVAALAVGGAAIGSAATSQGATTVTTTPSTHAPPGNMRAPGTAAHEDAEKPVTGDAADEAKAAALKAVGSGTAGDVTTDYFGTGYEVTVTKSDGSTVELHLDSSFDVRPGAACAVRATPR
jgi:hypothetical protein